MDSLKLEIIKKVLMLDTKQELQTMRENVCDAISREIDMESKQEDEFKKWKADRKAKEEMPF